MPLITCGACLAHYGLLGSVDYGLWLETKDLTPVPDEHLASLVSCVVDRVIIRDIRGCNLATILDVVKCERLIIISQSLSREETQALVRAMQTRLKRVLLMQDVTLDIGSLTKYNGQGKCTEIWLGNIDTMTRYKEELAVTWAMTRNWVVTKETNHSIIIQSL